MIEIDNPQYEKYLNVLKEAYEQAALGKGKDRHVNGDEPYEEQIVCSVNRQLGSIDGCLFQAIKKIYESKIFVDLSKSKHELLGAINYLAAAIILLQEKIDGINARRTDNLREESSLTN